MARDANIPIFLWVATAALLHILSGEGADEAAGVLEEQATLRSFVQSVREHLSGDTQAVEVLLLSDAAELEAFEKPSDRQNPDNVETPDDSAEEEKAVVPPETQPPTSPARPSPSTAPAVAPEKPTPIEAKPLETKPAETKPLEPLDLRGRISVKQHVADTEQEDNPNAEFLAEHANRVAEETQARITSNDQNDPSPTPGTNFAGPSDDPGNAAVTDVADSRDTPGDPDEAPGGEGGNSDGQPAQVAQSARAAHEGGEAPPGVAATPSVAAAQEAKAERQAQQETKEQLETSEKLSATDSQWFLRESAKRVEAQARQTRQRGQAARQGARHGSALGRLGTLGATQGGLNLDLNAGQAFAAIGASKLQQERLADGERRKSKHRGSFRTHGLERWRSALENYVAQVKPGNQTALNTARSPFANYIHDIHSRLHPQFAVRTLSQLDQLPASHPMNRPDLHTVLEIILDGQSGRIVRMGVLRSSGLTAFDIEPLEAMSRAAPFGPAPASIISPDGNVYLHWGFSRNPSACATYFAEPYLLGRETTIAAPTGSAPAPLAPESPGPAPTPKQEAPANPTP